MEERTLRKNPQWPGRDWKLALWVTGNGGEGALILLPLGSKPMSLTYWEHSIIQWTWLRVSAETWMMAAQPLRGSPSSMVSPTRQPWGLQETARPVTLTTPSSTAKGSTTTIWASQVASGKGSSCQCRSRKRHRFDPWVGQIPWRRAWQPILLFLPGESQGQRNWRATVHGVTESWTWLSVQALCYTRFCICTQYSNTIKSLDMV